MQWEWAYQYDSNNTPLRQLFQTFILGCSIEAEAADAEKPWLCPDLPKQERLPEAWPWRVQQKTAFWDGGYSWGDQWGEARKRQTETRARRNHANQTRTAPTFSTSGKSEDRNRDGILNHIININMERMVQIEKNYLKENFFTSVFFNSSMVTRAFIKNAFPVKF